MQTLRTATGLATAAALTGAMLTAATTAAHAAPGGVCAGIDKCRVVARVDVDGDGARDLVGWVSHRARSTVVIRVKTADGERLRTSLDVSRWYDRGVWGGAAHVDGRHGRELLVGTELGAHTPVYTMLTYRRRDLVVERAPTRNNRRWIVDSAYNVFAGWNRDRVDGKVLIRFTHASRSADNTFHGYANTYRWTNGRWARVDHRERHWPSARKAQPISGWHVRHLDRFPGL